MPRHWNLRAVALVGALCALPSGPVRGQAPAQAQASSGAARASPPAKDEQALAAIKEMSTTLASAKTLGFKMRGLVPMKVASGSWVTIVGTASVLREGKQKLFVEAGGDFFPFQFFLDGKSVTAFAPKEKIYAQREEAGTIDEVLDRAAKKGEAQFIFADVVSADPYAAMTKGLQRAFVVGSSVVEGVETQHLAVHAKDLDWEIWIGTKDRLPRMVTLTDLREARKPTHTVMFSDWALDASAPADAFTFKAPDDATKVPFRDPRQLKAVGRRPAPSPAN
jgi:hypothetical protein